MALSQAVAAWEEMTVFRHLDTAQLRILTHLLVAHSLKPGQRILTSGQRSPLVFFLLEGAVKVILPGVRGPAILNFCGPNEVLGEIGALSDSPPTADVVTIAPSRFLVMESATLRQQVQVMPQLGYTMNQIMAERMSQSTVHTQVLLSPDVRARLACLLLNYEQRFGEQCSNHLSPKIDTKDEVSPISVLPFPLTQQELAVTIGASRESVQKYLSCFRQRKIISQDTHHRIIIHDRIALQRYCKS